MKNLRIAVPSETRAAKLVTYLDSFDPGDFVDPERIEVAGQRIIPPLLTALAQQNVTVYVTHNLEMIADIQRNSGGKMRLVKVNDPACHPNASPNDTNAIVLMRDGVPVGCVASRLRWCERTLAEEMESGRFWVSQPATMWSPNDKCIAKTHMAKVIRACPVVYTGSVYLNASVTGGHTLAAMIRLHLLWLVTHWKWSWVVGLIEGPIIRRHAFDVYGVTSLETGVWRTRAGDSDLHQYELTLNEREASMEAWLSPDMADLDRPMWRLSGTSSATRPPQAANDGGIQ